MPINILMPALSPTMEKGNLAKWLKKEGDKVKSGDVIAEIETDKATMEVEAADEGTLGKILVPEGTADVAVNTPIAVILSDGEDKSSIKSKPASSFETPATRAPQDEVKKSPRPEEAPTGPREARPDDRLRARPGTHTSCPLDRSRSMGPRLRGDDSKIRNR